MPESATELSLGEMARWACLLEVCAPKAGNVHPHASFADTTWRDFIVSAQVTAPILNLAAVRGVGQTVRDCVHATNQAVGRNTNLGMLLLLAPLCAVPRTADASLSDGVRAVLGDVTQRDAQLIYEAIRQASPGGLGAAGDHDVRGELRLSFAQAMALASQWDAVARQHCNGYAEVFTFIAPSLTSAIKAGAPLSTAIVYAHLAQIAREPDSLIARKCGRDVAEEATRRARQVFARGWPGMPGSREEFAAFDAWLREDGNRRNPGTSADLVAAALFVLLWQGAIAPPFAWVDELLAPC